MKNITAYMRDASFFQNPNTSTPKVLHRIGEKGHLGLTYAACSNRIPLILEYPYIVYANSPMLCKRCFKDALQSKDE